jgi:hypothetical protein
MEFILLNLLEFSNDIFEFYQEEEKDQGNVDNETTFIEDYEPLGFNVYRTQQYLDNEGFYNELQ